MNILNKSSRFFPKLNSNIFQSTENQLDNELQKKKKIIMLLTAIFNETIRVGYFPIYWKMAQIILIPKLGKPSEDVTSYKYMSLSKIIRNFSKWNYFHIEWFVKYVTLDNIQRKLNN